MSCCWTLAKNALVVAVAVRGVAKVEGTSFGLSQPRLACLANEMKARARVCERVSDSVCVCVPDPGPDAGKGPTGRTLAGHQMQKAWSVEMQMEMEVKVEMAME